MSYYDDDIPLSAKLAVFAFLLLFSWLLAYVISDMTSDDIVLTASKWECSEMTYPSEERGDMFAPYCSQYTANMEE